MLICIIYQIIYIKSFFLQFGSIWFFLSSPLSVQAKETEAINILFFFEDPYSISSFDAALNSINENDQIKIGSIYRVNTSETDATKLVTKMCQQVDEAYGTEEKPDIAIDFTKKGIGSEAVKIVTRAMNLPTISGSFGQPGDIFGWKELSKKQSNYLIQVSPPADVLLEVMSSIVKMQDMSTAVLLFDNQYEVHHKHKSLLENLPTRHLLTPLEKSVSALRRQIDRLAHIDIANFFVAARPSQIESVLTEASDPNIRDGPYFGPGYAWYSMTMEPGLIRCSGCRDKVEVIHLSPKFRENVLNDKIFGKDVNSRKNFGLMEIFYFELTINAITSVSNLKANEKWVKPPFKICQDVTSIEDKYDVLLFSEFQEVSSKSLLPLHIAKGQGNSHLKFEMNINRLTFKPFQAEPVENLLLGTWMAGFSTNSISSEGNEHHWVGHRAMNVFRVVTVLQPPFVYRMEDCDTPTDTFDHCYEGYCIDLLDMIAEELGFNYTIHNVTDYGWMDDNGKWSGMIRELTERKADIALGALSVLPEREQVVDFTIPFYDPVGISILMRRLKVPTSLFKFLTVLENDVWLCILGAYFFTSFLMWVFDRWSPYSYQNNREKFEDDEEKREFNLKECLWFCITSLTPQGGGEAPKNLSGRLVAATWWLFGFIIIASYTANLAAFLTVSRLDAPVESLDDLARQYKIQYAPLKDSSTYIYFDRMAHVEHRFYEIWKDMSLNDSMDDFERSQLAVWDYPISDKFTKIWQAMMENVAPSSMDDALSKVRGDPNNPNEFALLDEATNVQYQTLISCDFRQVGEEFSRKPYAIAVQKGSPLKYLFSETIQKLRSYRYMEQLNDTWWESNELRATCPEDDHQSGGISIHNIGGVFIVILFGVTLATLTIFVEYIWVKSRFSVMNTTGPTLPHGKNFVNTFANEKTFTTKYNNKSPSRISDLPTVENSY